jgi:hypothetical protein
LIKAGFSNVSHVGLCRIGFFKHSPDFVAILPFLLRKKTGIPSIENGPLRTGSKAVKALQAGSKGLMVIREKSPQRTDIPADTAPVAPFFIQRERVDPQLIFQEHVLPQTGQEKERAEPLGSRQMSEKWRVSDFQKKLLPLRMVDEARNRPRHGMFERHGFHLFRNSLDDTVMLPRQKPLFLGEGQGSDLLIRKFRYLAAQKIY